MSNGVLLHRRPTSVGILFTPGTPGFWIVGSLRREIIERAAIILQIEHAIALLEIEICSVQLTAWRSPPAKFRCTNERFGILRVERGRSGQDQQEGQASAVRVSLMRNSIPLGKYTSHRLRGIHHVREGVVQGRKAAMELGFLPSSRLMSRRNWAPLSGT